MKITLTQTIPSQDGYYLIKFSEQGGLHLVLLQTELDGRRVIVPDVCPFKSLRDKKDLKCICKAEHLYFYDFPTICWWSEIINTGA